MADLVVKSKVKDFAQGMNVGADFIDALDDAVKALVARAVERAKENGRSTLKGRDA
ncbi:MAG: DUF1931 domain-containing protein [Candidatus Altiarchaeales archaeon]|nr:DUF1931 domain-containing protein [Candidatus Altiarchaeales archaeon]